MLQAITGGQQEVGEDMEPEDLGTVAEINRLIAKGMHETDAIHAVAKKYGDDPSELASFYYQHNRMHEGTVTGGQQGVAEADSYMESLAATLAEKLKPNDPPEKYIHYFLKGAQTPNAKGHHQFRNKSKAKVIQMANAASYAAKEKK